jgi:tripartite-type tricarboxylate transporter receptor subunit TctC
MRSGILEVSPRARTNKRDSAGGGMSKRRSESMFVRRLACALVTTALLLAQGRVVRSASIDFSGKTLTFVIPSSVGGNTDAIARVFGRFLPDYLPGKPTIIYQNIPGAGGITAVNYFANQVKPDGLTSLAGSASNIEPTVIRMPAVQYDSKKLLMYGGFPSPSSLVIVRKGAIPQFYDASKKPAIMGDVSADRSTDQMAVWGPRYLNWNVRWVLGYPGTPDLVLALRRGEIDLMVTYGDALIDQFRKGDGFVFPAQSGDSQHGVLVRSARFPDIPLFSDLVRPKLKDPLELSTFRAWELIAQSGKWFALPPGTPPQIVDFYRKAFLEVIATPAFVAEASKVLGVGYTVATGEDVQKVDVALASVGDDELGLMEALRQRVGIHTEITKK